MYVHCMFCRVHLASNEVIEHFPIGRRLAFDAAKGRLWVVCRTCTRWNLTPLEERWEAIEDCERVFATVRTRVSTEQIGLARTREGLELVRIGSPLRPEFAAWRYGDQFGRRWRHHAMVMGGTGAILVGAAVAGPMLGIAAGVSGAILGTGVRRWSRSRDRIARVPTGSRSIHRFVEVHRHHLDKAHLYRSEDRKGLALDLPTDQGVWTLENDRALGALRQLMPAINVGGARSADVQDAVAAIERRGDPMHFVLAIAGSKPWNASGNLATMQSAFRLGLEMAVNEESERAALEGELSALHESWKGAEEIASISDNMFVPAWIERFIEEHRPTVVAPTIVMPPRK